MIFASGNTKDKVQLDEHLCEQLYNRYYARLYQYAFQFSKNAHMAEDLVHEVFLKLWEHRDTINLVAIESLLFKMTRNMCLNYLKHLKIVQNVHVDLVAIKRWEELYHIEFVRDEPFALIEKELEQKMDEILNDLPERCREVFILSRRKGMKNRQIAEQLNISLKTVEKHISHALFIFRNELPLFASLQLGILIVNQGL